MKKVLYSFNWHEGGFNSVWAGSKREAVAKATELGAGVACVLHPAPSTFVRRASRKAQEAYWTAMPLMD